MHLGQVKRVYLGGGIAIISREAIEPGIVVVDTSWFDRDRAQEFVPGGVRTTQPTLLSNLPSAKAAPLRALSLASMFIGESVVNRLAWRL